MKIKSVHFLKSATNNTHFPQFTHPEFAFLGRSNVGKSSLINMVTGQKSLVKTGSKPGVTQTINFFMINDAISLVDLPGFGYANVPKVVKKKFLPMIRDYVNNRENLKLVFLLIDIRRVPGDFEKEIITYLSKKNIPIAVILTKIDKISKNQRIHKIQNIATELEIDAESLFLTSSLKKKGQEEIWNIIDDYTKAGSSDT